MSVPMFKFEIPIEKIVGEERFDLLFVLDIKHTVEFDIPPSGDIIAESRLFVVNCEFRGSDYFKDKTTRPQLKEYFRPKRYYLTHFDRTDEPSKNLTEKQSANVDKYKFQLTKEIKEIFLL